MVIIIWNQFWYIYIYDHGGNNNLKSIWYIYKYDYGGYGH